MIEKWIERSAQNKLRHAGTLRLRDAFTHGITAMGWISIKL
jgi:hypothetical protein